MSTNRDGAAITAIIAVNSELIFASDSMFKRNGASVDGRNGSAFF